MEKIDEIHRIIKNALRGDLQSIINVFDYFSQFSNNAIVTKALYLLTYQIIMNVSVDTSKECELCGGICCKYGALIPLYSFDIDDLLTIIDKENLYRALICHGDCYLRRPCPFQDGWRCSVHKYKPYACLSYPFATEEEQIEILRSSEEISIVVPKIPSYCLAAKKTWSIIYSIIKNFREQHNRYPSPMELLQYFIT
ncbi:conserved hypothetical protein [Ignisphaera aggregans DSM 17230]|uniref:YkgJ family cysteine cluster protein n=1 Tax=Ignisphaera aggregans (strain DSM 17230 / JCM 13409 / AQ1.S1) TaxID=583356 RepID=E0SQC7_IGNAA|nr:conserved hypothetical protein [Ignisphaera aggregans DSM 17230]